MRSTINKHKRLTAFLASLVIGVSLIATAQGVQGEMRRFYNIDQGFANSQYVPKFLQGIMVGTTAYTNAQLNAALAGGSGPGIVTVSDTITAGATQTQAGATLLTSTFNNVTVVATAGDGVRLPTAAAGLKVTVRNSDSTDTLKVWPFLGDSINALAVNLSIDLPALTEVTLTAKNGTIWYSENGQIYIPSPTTLGGGTSIVSPANAGNWTKTLQLNATAGKRLYQVIDPYQNVTDEGNSIIPTMKVDSKLSAAGTAYAPSASTEAVVNGGTVQFGANELSANNIIQFTAAFRVGAINATDTFTTRVRLGGVSGTVVASHISGATTAANDVIILRGEINAASFSTPNTTFIASGTGNGLLAGVAGVSTATVVAGFTKDTTAALDLVATGQFSTNSATNSATLQQFNVRILGGQ